jgi:uncharacterized integral membrane protein (TIGR00698 family)
MSPQPESPECCDPESVSDLHTFCGRVPDKPAHRVVRWLLPLGVIGALLPWTPPWAALLGGTILALTLGNPCASKTGSCSKWLLQLSVVGLGAGVNLGVAARVGAQGLGYTLVGLLATFALGAWLSKRLGVAPKVAALVCAGTSICGGSAIAAAAPAIDADSGETSASLATVFLLNAVALLIFPPIGTLAGLDQHAYGLWCALAIHDTSSVTGAALAHGHDALVTATTVKLARALWIIPVAFTLGWWFRSRNGTSKKTGLQVPWFIVGFVVLSAVFTLMPSWKPVAVLITKTAHSGLTLTLFFIGAGLNMNVVRAVGPRPFVLGVVLWVLVGGATLIAIMNGWIH